MFSNVRQRQSKGQLVSCGCLIQGEGGTHFGKGRQEVIDGEDIGFVGGVEESHDLSGGGTIFDEERRTHFQAQVALVGHVHKRGGAEAAPIPLRQQMRGIVELGEIQLAAHRGQRDKMLAFFLGEMHHGAVMLPRNDDAVLGVVGRVDRRADR